MINPALETHFDFRAVADGGFLAHWTPPGDCPYFAGHFPGTPILPGVAVVDVTLEILRRALVFNKIHLFKIHSAKFMQPIVPGQPLEITLQPTEPVARSWKVRWSALPQPDGRIAVAELALDVGQRSG